MTLYTFTHHNQIRSSLSVSLWWLMSPSCCRWKTKTWIFSMWLSQLTLGHWQGLSQCLILPPKDPFADPHVTGQAQLGFYCVKSPMVKTGQDPNSNKDYQIRLLQHGVTAFSLCIYACVCFTNPIHPSQLNHISVQWAEAYINSHSALSRNGSQRGGHQLSSV